MTPNSFPRGEQPKPRGATEIPVLPIGRRRSAGMKSVVDMVMQQRRQQRQQ